MQLRNKTDSWRCREEQPWDAVERINAWKWPAKQINSAVPRIRSGKLFFFFLFFNAVAFMGFWLSDSARRECDLQPCLTCGCLIHPVASNNSLCFLFFNFNFSFFTQNTFCLPQFNPLKLPRGHLVCSVGFSDLCVLLSAICYPQSFYISNDGRLCGLSLGGKSTIWIWRKHHSFELPVYGVYSLTHQIMFRKLFFWSWDVDWSLRKYPFLNLILFSG